MTKEPTYEALEQRIHDLENAFRESENRYRQLYSNAPVMAHSIDPDGVLLGVSEFWLEKMGYGAGRGAGSHRQPWRHDYR